MEPIHLFVPTYRVDECLAEIRECLEAGWTGAGFKTIAFEDAWKEYTGLPNAHFLASGTAGLHLAIRLLKEQGDWKDGDEVITTPFTFVSTNHAIRYERLQPVFADVDRYLCLDPESVAERVTDRTRAVMFVGLGGNTGNLRAIMDLCRTHDLRLIIDGAHMSGTRWDGRHVGVGADVAVFSFHAVKNLPTADAGMVCFLDSELDEQVRKWSWMGINSDTFSRSFGPSKGYRWRYSVENVGFKYHGNSVMAALGLVALRHLDEDNAYRREMAGWYDKGLADSPGVELVPMATDCVPSRHLYQVLVAERDEVVLALNSAGIYPGVHYRDNTYYPMYSHADGDCPRARSASESVISLPLHLKLGRTDIDRVSAVLSDLTRARPISG